MTQAAMDNDTMVAVTPEARKAAADLLDEVSSLLGDTGIGQVADLIRDGEYDDHDATLAFARFERDILARSRSEGGCTIPPDHPLAKGLRTSQKALDEIKRQEQANIAGYLAMRDMPIGSVAADARDQSGRTGAGEALEERALAIVKAHYPEMPASYRGRRYQIALAALTEAADKIASLRARVEVQRNALIEAEIVFGLVEHPSFPDPDYQGRIEALGSEIGYGAMMAGASAAWRKSGIVPGGEFVAGPCQATITRTLEIIRQALKASPVE